MNKISVGDMVVWSHVCGCEVPVGFVCPQVHAAAVPRRNNVRGKTEGDRKG